MRATPPTAADAGREPGPDAEQAANESPVALPISISEKASSFGTRSRLNHASSNDPSSRRAGIHLGVFSIRFAHEFSP
jgi:hypothetical protein